MPEFKFFNTLVQRVEPFPKKPGEEVKIYSCGPTIYDYAHIGNFRSYIFADILRRSLILDGYKVNHAMNLTDVDDKTIKASLKIAGDDRVWALREATQPYAQAFFEDLQKLHIGPFEHHPRATENIEAMVELVDKLTQRGYTYTLEGSVYFSIERKKDYGKLSHIDLSNVKHGARYSADEYDKEDARDFVLWKAEKESEGVNWKTSLGTGRPGWHLECSAMIEKLFHGPIDIHTGGIDLVFPHHENEIAQSECGYGHTFVTFWMHNEHLLVNNKKMSKSAGNFFTIRDLLHQNYSPETIRYHLISCHYRQKMNFTLDGLVQSRAALEKIQQFASRLSELRIVCDNEDIQGCEKAREYRENFMEQLRDDLNTPRALAEIFEFMKYANKKLDACENKVHETLAKSLKETFETMEFLLQCGNKSALNVISPELQNLLTERNKARTEKNFQEADRLRDMILSLGYKILDSKDGAKLEKIQ